MPIITIDCLRASSGFSQKNKDSFMWTLIGDDQEFVVVIEPRTHYECSLCEKSPRSQYSLVQHVQGQHHQRLAAKHRLTEDALAAVAAIEGPGFGKNFSVVGGPGNDLGFKCRICKDVGYFLDTQREIVDHVCSHNHQVELDFMRSLFPLKRNSSFSLPEKVQLMWKLVRSLESDQYQRGHFRRTGLHSFECCLCNVSVSSPFNAAQHARGNAHQAALRKARARYAQGYDSDEGSSDFYIY